MGYTVHYGTAIPKQFSKPKIPMRVPAALLLLVLSVTAIRGVWPDEMKQLQHALLPWTQPASREAFADLVEDIGEGEPFKDAVTAFCEELLHEAGSFE